MYLKSAVSVWNADILHGQTVKEHSAARSHKCL